VPFPGENFVAVAMRHINEPPPSIRERRPDVPPRVEAAVHRAMAKDPRDRFATMAELADELEACLGELEAGDATRVNVPVRSRRSSGARTRTHRARTWPIVALVLVALVAAAALVAYALTRDDGGNATGASGSGASGATVHLRGVTAYDPYGTGTGGEHDSDAPKATDGDTATYWPTETYRSAFADIGKKGVGLVLDAGHPVRLRTIGIVTDTPGFTAEIRAGPSPTSFPAELAAAKQVGGRTQYDLSADGDHRYYEIWITELPPGGHVAHVNEVKAA